MDIYGSLHLHDCQICFVCTRDNERCTLNTFCVYFWNMRVIRVAFERFVRRRVNFRAPDIYHKFASSRQ